jgi:hypothetical protein
MWGYVGSQGVLCFLCESTSDIKYHMTLMTLMTICGVLPRLIFSVDFWQCQRPGAGKKAHSQLTLLWAKVSWTSFSAPINERGEPTASYGGTGGV